MATAAKRGAHKQLDERERKRMQHELKIYMEQYFKSKLGKGVDHTKVTIWEDLMVIRGEGFIPLPVGNNGAGGGQSHCRAVDAATL
mgnify:CR=1 FL=1